MANLTNVERLRKAGLIRGTLPREYKERINMMRSDAVDAFIKLRQDLDKLETDSANTARPLPHYHDFMNVPF